MKARPVPLYLRRLAALEYGGLAHMANDLRIELLADHPEAVPELVSWFEHEWAPYYGTNGPGDAEGDLRASCSRRELPLALVALFGEQLVGTAALKQESVTTHRHLTPWLAALLVAPEFRRKGIGGRLVAAVEDTARQLGFTSLYVGTGAGSATSERVLRARGWEFLEKKPYFVSEVSIFRKVL